MNCPSCGRPSRRGRLCLECAWPLPPVTRLPYRQAQPLLFGLSMVLGGLSARTLIQTSGLLAFTVLGPALLLLPLLAQLMPTPRRHGGCLLGLAASLGAMVAAVFVPVLAPPPQPGQVQVRIDPRVPVTCAGVMPGMTESQVERKLGKGTPAVLAPQAGYEQVAYGPIEVLYSHGRAVRVAGPSLESQGRELLQVGDPRTRLRQLFAGDPPLGYQPLRDGRACLFEFSGGRVRQIALMADDLPVSLRLPVPDLVVDGIALGSPIRAVTGPLRAVGGLQVMTGLPGDHDTVDRGATVIRFKFGRVAIVMGRELRCGDRVYRVGDPAPENPPTSSKGQFLLDVEKGRLVCVGVADTSPYIEADLYFVRNEALRALRTP